MAQRDTNPAPKSRINRGFDGFGRVEFHDDVERGAPNVMPLQRHLDDAPRARAALSHQQRGCGNFGACNGGAFGPLMRGRHNQHELIDEKWLGLDIAAVRRALDKAKSDLLLYNRAHNLLGISADQRRLHARMLAAEFAQQARQNILRDGCGGAQRKMPGVFAAQGCDALLGFGQQDVDPACIFEQRRFRLR